MRVIRAIDLASGPGTVEERQRALASDVVIQPGDVNATLIASADVAYAKDSDDAYAAVVVIERGTWREIDRATHVGKAPHAYQSGAFSLREAGCLLPAFQALATRPDVLVIDGQGTAHPRRFGLACHLGVMFDLPTVGCAKTLLCGEHAKLDEPRGATADIVDDGAVIGAAVRTQTGIKPVFVSPGHRFDVASACALILALAPDYRQPEPIRQAHHLSIMLRAGTPA